MLGFASKVPPGILRFLLINEDSADGHLPFTVSEKTCRVTQGQWLLGASRLFFLSYHLYLDHSIRRICTFSSVLIPEKPLCTPTLFIEKNCPALSAGGWTFTVLLPWGSWDKLSWTPWQPHGGLLQPSLWSLSWKRSSGFLLYSEQTLGSSYSALNM